MRYRYVCGLTCVATTLMCDPTTDVASMTLSECRAPVTLCCQAGCIGVKVTSFHGSPSLQGSGSQLNISFLQVCLLFPSLNNPEPEYYLLDSWKICFK